MNSTAFTQWLALTLLPGIGSARLKTLLPLFAAALPHGGLDETAARMAEIAPALQQKLNRILQCQYNDDVRKVSDHCLAWASKPGHCIRTLGCQSYPLLLREIAEPPPFLFIAGDPALLALPQLGIVGSRRPTADGRRNARQFAAQLVSAGYQITSGLAEGIDAESHTGALQQQGRTIAVLGSGIEHIFPKKNQRLAQDIMERGAVISEFLPHVKPVDWHFPRRNRIISGLSHGILVVEAAQRSGSLITARLAAEQGREVFVIPGSIRNPMARGCHQLIRQGATLVEGVDDILAELPALIAWERSQAQAAPAGLAELSEPQRRVLGFIAYDPVSVDMLAQRSGLPLPELYTHLLQMELQGVIEKLEAGYVLSPG